MLALVIVTNMAEVWDVYYEYFVLENHNALYM